MLYQVQSARSLEEIERGLRGAAARNRFGIIAVHDLRGTMQEKGVDLGMDCRIFEVCNPLQAKQVLDADGAISTALPCRISVYGAKGKYFLATMRPVEMMKAFGKPELEPVAREVETAIVRMMQEAAKEPASR